LAGFGLVLGGHWAGFLTSIWQHCSAYFKHIFEYSAFVAKMIEYIYLDILLEMS